MRRTTHQSGIVVMPADVALSTESQSSPAHPITINALKLPDEDIAKQLLPLFVLSEAGIPKMLVEINRFSHPFGSWLVVPEDVNLVPEVCSNGNMTFVTRVDPLFPALALMDCLRKVTGIEVFQPLEAMCISSDGTNLDSLCEPQQFTLICDVKEAAGNNYYRLSDEKVTKWLVQKHANLMKHPQMNSETASQIISQYLPVTWQSVLLKALGLSLKADSLASSVPQKGEDLAMAIMMEDAKETNRAKRLLQRTNNSNSLNTRTTKSNTTKRARRQSGTASKFWSSVKSKQRS